jgi:mannose-6-phosphate isomerase-like protein (cupin superfamily)
LYLFDGAGFFFGGDTMALKYPLVHLDDIEPEAMDEDAGWSITEFRLPISKKQGSSSTMFHSIFMPGSIHKKHRHDNCDEIYSIVRGHGLAGAGTDRVEVRKGHFHYIPKGVEHWLYNLSNKEPVEIIGVYIGAGSVKETGYVYLGDVTEEDLQRRTDEDAP